MTTDNEKLLEQTFAQMTAKDVPLSDGLMDRIMLDADQVLAGSMPAVEPRLETTQGLGAALLDAIGGWMSFGGLTAAAMIGLWVGVFPPDLLYEYSTGVWGDTIEVPLLESDVFSGLEG
ncbi:hypothetical protein N9O61_05705 [Octadecabacter sp.]|nr:hypothetical protein [Octadecabacter sp.]